jgi:hypothetical protein
MPDLVHIPADHRLHLHLHALIGQLKHRLLRTFGRLYGRSLDLMHPSINHQLDAREGHTHSLWSPPLFTNLDLLFSILLNLHADKLTELIVHFLNGIHA